MKDPTDYRSEVMRDGERGRPPMEPSKSMTVRMHKKRHLQMVDYCVEHGVSQRVFIEEAAPPLVMNNDFARMVRLRRRHPSRFDADNQETEFVTLRFNKRLSVAVTCYCIDRDISQVEFLELAIETLCRNKEFSKAMKARRVQLLEQRDAYNTTK